ncbi:hypothetical protein ACFQ1I_22230 [Kitasatospora arboriphila]
MDAIRAESLHFHGLRHGYHHERYFEDLGPVAEALLGICFCPHCLAAASADGVPAEEVRTAVRDELRARLADEKRAAEPAALDGFAAAPSPPTWTRPPAPSPRSPRNSPRRPPPAACG